MINRSDFILEQLESNIRFSELGSTFFTQIWTVLKKKLNAEESLMRTQSHKHNNEKLKFWNNNKNIWKMKITSL